MDEDEVAFKAKQAAGRDRLFHTSFTLLTHGADAKARKEMADKAKGKGPLNAGQQGIKKSGKK